MIKPTPLFPSGEVPEWLDELREADLYNLDMKHEVALIEKVEAMGLPEHVVLKTVRSLSSQWPYKRHKHIDRTLLAWLGSEVDRRSATTRPYEAERARSDDFSRAYVERQRARGTLPEQREPSTLPQRERRQA